MCDDDSQYYRARAEQELASARSATSSAVARIHFAVAGRYLDLIHNQPAAPVMAMPRQGH